MAGSHKFGGRVWGTTASKHCNFKHHPWWLNQESMGHSYACSVLHFEPNKSWMYFKIWPTALLKLISIKQVKSDCWQNYAERMVIIVWTSIECLLCILINTVSPVVTSHKQFTKAEVFSITTAFKQYSQFHGFGKFIKNRTNFTRTLNHECCVLVDHSSGKAWCQE